MDTTQKRSRGRPKSDSAASSAGTVQALDRGLTLLKLLAKESRATLTDLSTKVDMPPSSAYRLLNTMQQHGFAEFDETTQDWMVGVEAFRIGSAFTQRTKLVEASREAMHRLMEETGETSNLAIGDDGDVVFISQVETNHPIRAFFPPGARSAMHASGIGKALLAEMLAPDVEKIVAAKGLEKFTDKTLTSAQTLFADLAETKERGWSFDDEERHPGMRCVASPIYNAFGKAIAGVSVSGPTARFTDLDVSKIGPQVKRAAATITDLLGGSPRAEEGA